MTHGIWDEEEEENKEDPFGVWLMLLVDVGKLVGRAG